MGNVINLRCFTFIKTSSENEIFIHILFSDEALFGVSSHGQMQKINNRTLQ